MRFCSYFDNCFGWFFRTNWLTYCWSNRSCIRIHCVRCRDRVFSRSSFCSNWFWIFVTTCVTFITNWRWYFFGLNCWRFGWAIRCGPCRCYISCIRIYCVRCRSSDSSTFRIFSCFYLRFCSYFDNFFFWFCSNACCFTFRYTSIRIYSVRCCSYYFTVFTFCVCCFFSFWFGWICFIADWFFNWCLYYFRFCSYFDNCCCWFFRTNWLTFCWSNHSCLRIHCIRCRDRFFSRSSFFSNWIWIFVTTCVTFITDWRWDRSCHNCWVFGWTIRCSRCRSYISCLRIYCVRCRSDDSSTFRIFRLFNLSFRTNFNNCFACWGDDWITNVFCDMTVLWIYIVSGCSNCFTFFTLSTLSWCTEVFFNIFNVFHFWFNRGFYDFIFGTNFNDFWYHFCSTNDRCSIRYRTISFINKCWGCCYYLTFRSIISNRISSYIFGFICFIPCCYRNYFGYDFGFNAIWTGNVFPYCWSKGTGTCIDFVACCLLNNIIAFFEVFNLIFSWDLDHCRSWRFDNWFSFMWNEATICRIHSISGGYCSSSWSTSYCDFCFTFSFCRVFFITNTWLYWRNHNLRFSSILFEDFLFLCWS